MENDIKRIKELVNKEPAIQLVPIIANFIQKEISPQAAVRFSSLEDLRGIETQPEHIQRIVINQALLLELLIWRSNNNKAVYDVAGFLYNEGELKDWIGHLALYVIPFLKKNNILGV